MVFGEKCMKTITKTGLSV